MKEILTRRSCPLTHPRKWGVCWPGRAGCVVTVLRSPRQVCCTRCSARKRTASRAPGTSAPGHLSSGGGTPSKYMQVLLLGARKGFSEPSTSSSSEPLQEALAPALAGEEAGRSRAACGPGETAPLAPLPTVQSGPQPGSARQGGSYPQLRRWPFMWNSALAGLGKCIVLFHPWHVYCREFSDLWARPTKLLPCEVLTRDRPAVECREGGNNEGEGRRMREGS